MSRLFYCYTFIVYSFAYILLSTGSVNAENLRGCPVSFPDLADELTKNLPDYLNRTYTRVGINRHALVASLPETSILPISSIDRDLSSPNQIFVSILSGKIGQPKNQTQPYWLFISRTNNGWHLAMAFTRIGNSAIIDVSDGAIADATNTWLRDRCH